MTILLRLDTNAVDALFPEGTQARVELQQAVIAEIIRRQIKPEALGESVTSQIAAARADALNAIKRARDDAAGRAFEEQGVAKSTWGGVELKPGAKAVINEAARQAVRDEITNVIAEQIGIQAERLRGTVTHDAQAAVNRMIDREIQAAVKARVAAVVEQMGKGVL